MAETPNVHVEKKYAKYLRSGCWICTDSPTGAHHWIEDHEEKQGTFVCIHCREVKEFPYTFIQATEYI